MASRRASKTGRERLTCAGVRRESCRACLRASLVVADAVLHFAGCNARHPGPADRCGVVAVTKWGGIHYASREIVACDMS